jgi:hypothetical protein
MDEPSPNAVTSSPYTAWRAVLIGHLVINIPVLAIIAATSVLGLLVFSAGHLLIIVAVAVVPGWLYWSAAVPRWRRWSLRKGADAEQVERLAQYTLLVWPRK